MNIYIYIYIYCYNLYLSKCGWPTWQDMRLSQNVKAESVSDLWSPSCSSKSVAQSRLEFHFDRSDSACRVWFIANLVWNSIMILNLISGPQHAQKDWPWPTWVPQSSPRGPTGPKSHRAPSGGPDRACGAQATSQKKGLFLSGCAKDWIEAHNQPCHSTCFHKVVEGIYAGRTNNPVVEGHTAASNAI